MSIIANKAVIREFVDRWKTAEGDEEQESRSFWIEFAEQLLGISDPTVNKLEFERKVRGRRIDVFYEDMRVLVEQKSRGVDLDKATQRSKKVGPETPYQQAKWYADNLRDSVRPRWLITSNFDEFRIYDLDRDNPESECVTVALEELPEQLPLFSFYIDESASRLVKERELSIEAGEIVGRLYQIFAAQYDGLESDPEAQRSLNMLIVRLVFLLYAEDAGVLQKPNAFLDYMKSVPAEHFRTVLLELFEVLDTPYEKRSKHLDEKLAAFPYVNGGLFADRGIDIPQFTTDAKHELLFEAGQKFNWAGISPTIFGAAFESTLNPETRRFGGMHYTSIENIHKVIDPLFLDDLKAELKTIEGEKVQKTRHFKLRQFQNKLASINIIDPACGSGNFLTESYLCLRKLENQVLESLAADQTGQFNQTALDTGEANGLIKVSLDQLYGIEINDFAVTVAKTALWISEEQMLDETQELLQVPFEFLPLKSNDNIVEGNALQIDWGGGAPCRKVHLYHWEPAIHRRVYVLFGTKIRGSQFVRRCEAVQFA